jgi:quercetin dioxygenase-like cupin family protein
VPFVHTADTLVHEMHGARFTSYATPALGSTRLCAWQLTIPAGTIGVAHTLNHEEVFVVTAGAFRFTVDGTTDTLAPGEAVVVPAGQQLQVDNVGDEPASALVTTSVGIQGTMADGSTITPPWSR